MSGGSGSVQIPSHSIIRCVCVRASKCVRASVVYVCMGRVKGGIRPRGY